MFYMPEELVQVNEETIKSILRAKKECSSYSLMLEYKNYIARKQQSANLKSTFEYKESKLSFTYKQIEILKLVAKGFSNLKITKKLLLKESTVKLNIYRVMRYIERVLLEKVDRFYLIIIAQNLDLESNNDVTKVNLEDLSSIVNHR